MSQIDNKSPIDGVICTIVSGAPRSRVWRGRLFEGIEMPQTMKSSAHPSAQAGRRLSRAVPVFTRWADMALPAAIGRYPRIASSTASCSTTKSCQVRSSSPPAACMAPSSASKGLVGAGNLGQVGLGDRDDTNKSAVAVEANQCRLFLLPVAVGLHVRECATPPPRPLSRRRLDVVGHETPMSAVRPQAIAHLHDDTDPLDAHHGHSDPFPLELLAA